MNKNLLVFKTIFFPIFSALLLILAFLPANFYWVAFFSLVPLFFFIQKCSSGKFAFLGGLVSGFIFFGYLMSYFFSAYPLDWAGIESSWGLFFVALIWLVNSLTLGLFFGFFCLLGKKIIEKPSFFTPLGLASGWVIFEYLRSYWLGVFWFGPGSVFGPHWSIGHLGYVLANNGKLLQLAGWGGIYLLSFFVVAVNALVFGIFINWQEEKNRKLVFLKAATLFLFLIAASVLGDRELNSKSKVSENSPRVIKAALIQTDFPSVFREDFSSLYSRAKTLLDLIEKIKDKQEQFDIVVMNERHHFLKLLSRTQSYTDRQKIFSNFPADILVDVKPGITDSGQSSLLFYFNPKTDRIVDEQKKIMLIPGGEYMPYLIRLFASLIGETDWLEDFLLVRGYENVGELKVIDLDFGKVGGLLCSEILSPVLYRSLAGKGAELLINVASDSIFRGHPLLLSQNLAMAKVRAAENNRYSLQAINAGLSYIIDNKGEVMVSGNKKGNDVIFGEAKIISQPSFYIKTGDWILIFSAILIFYWLFIRPFLKRKRLTLFRISHD